MTSRESQECNERAFHIAVYKLAHNLWSFYHQFLAMGCRAVARTLIGGCIFIYSGYARLTSFEINSISKETSRAEPEYMNIHLPN